MRVALGENDSHTIIVDVDDAEYRNLLGFIGSHCDFGLTPESVFAAWENDYVRTLRDVLQFAADHVTNDVDRMLVIGELDSIQISGIRVDFIVRRTVKRHILGFIPGVSKTKTTVDDCTLDDLFDLMLRFGNEATLA